jgi:hypothetical protein
MAKLLRARIPAVRVVLAGAGMLVLLTSPASLAHQERDPSPRGHELAPIVTAFLYFYFGARVEW